MPYCVCVHIVEILIRKKIDYLEHGGVLLQRSLKKVLLLGIDFILSKRRRKAFMAQGA